VLDAAGDEIIAGAFGGTSAKDGRFYVEEAVLVEMVAHHFDDAVAQLEISLGFRAAKVEKAILQTQVLARLILGRWQKWRRGGAIEDGQLIDAKLNLAGRQFRIGRSFGPSRDFAGDLQDPFAADRFGELEVFGAAFGRDDDLRLAVAVAQIDEEDALVVAIGIDPAAERDGLADVRGSELAAGVSAKHGLVSGCLCVWVGVQPLGCAGGRCNVKA